MLQPGESGARLLHFGLQLLQVNAGNGVKGAAHIAISSMLMILYELTYPFAICFQCVFNRACFPVGQTDSCEHLLQDVAGHCCLLLQPYYHFPTKTTGCQSHAKSRIYILIHFKLHTLTGFCSMRHINCEWQKRKDPPCKAMGTWVTTLRLATDSLSAATQPAAPPRRLFPWWWSPTNFVFEAPGLKCSAKPINPNRSNIITCESQDVTCIFIIYFYGHFRGFQFDRNHSSLGAHTPQLLEYPEGRLDATGKSSMAGGL